MRFKAEQRGDHYRYLYTRKLEEHIHNPTVRNWSVSGDKDTLQTAEEFRLHYDLDRYRGGLNPYQPNEHQDILAHYLDARVVATVYDAKTQGFPYHIPLLAIGMLLETRLSPFALVTGDIDQDQAKRAKQWADPLLSSPLVLPAVTDLHVLLKRARCSYQGIELLSFLQTCYRGPTDQFYDLVVAELPRPVVEEWFLKQLRHYTAPNQIGVRHLFLHWLNATRDLRRLCHIACLDTNGPGFDPTDFARSIVKLGLFHPNQRDVRNPFEPPSGTPHTVYSMLGAALYDVASPGRSPNWHMPLEQGMTVFRETFPAAAKSIDQMVTEVENVQNTDRSPDKMDWFAKLGGNDEDMEDDFSIEKLLLQYREGIEYTRGQEEWLYCIAHQIKSLMVEFAKSREKSSLQYNPQQLISIFAHRHQIVLSEEAWQLIDSETDRQVLQLLQALVMIDNMELHFCQVRRAIFENTHLRRRLLQLMDDDAAMSRAEQIVGALGDHHET